MMSPYAPPPAGFLDIVFRDESLLVVNKPSGLLSVPGRGPEKADCLISRVQSDDPLARIVHRLDMETSGLLILALSDEMQRTLSMMFERRAVNKTYVALVAGAPAQDEGLVDLPLAKDWPNRPLQKVDLDAGKPSQTRWRVMRRAKGHALLELEPVTGRTHQLRVHMEAIGHPILGDTLYGDAVSRAGAERLALHACRLRFDHPVTGAVLDLRSTADFISI